ncbi:MAG: tyrosine-protein phosphatase [Oscillospiraceae bacterium]|nr:tyrosine-protein phosphatase [Oscillospiraceae bacterium]
MNGYRRLPVEGMCNARDLGGYPASDGRMTNYGRFIRSEVPRAVTRRGLDFLRDYGVAVSIDLRGPEEIKRIPNLLADEPWAEFINIPVYNKQVAGAVAKASSDHFVKWPDLYISMIDSQMEWIRDVFTALAEKSGSGAVMFNCTTGKDRTGMITALLLALAGVSYYDIVADYCVSQVYLRPVYAEIFGTWDSPALDVNGLDDPFFKTVPENMASLLIHIDNEYGGVPQYLERCGISGNDLDLLRAALLG